MSAHDANMLVSCRVQLLADVCQSDWFRHSCPNRQFEMEELIIKKVSVPITNNFCPQTLFLYGTYKEDGMPNFGLFCWFSYCWDSRLGVMACIAGD